MDEEELKQILKKAVNLREEGVGWRKIHKRLKENVDSYNYGSHTTLYNKAKPVINGERTIEEAASGGQLARSEDRSEKRESNEIPDKDDLEIYSGEEEKRGKSGGLTKYLVIVVWIIALILAYFGFLK